MNIVLYTHQFLPSLGGRQFVVHHLAAALSELGHRVRVLGPAGLLKYRGLRLPYPVHRWPGSGRILREKVWSAQLSLDTRIWGCDVIHAHLTYPSGYLAAIAKRRRGYPLVITPHGGDIQAIPEVGHGLGLDPDARKKIDIAVREADYVTAISNDVADRLLDAGARAERIRLVRNGVDVDRFNVARCGDIREWLHVAPNARLLVTVGKYRPVKGHEVMVRAMPKILGSEPRARLVIVGDDTETLQPLIAELGLQGHVLLTGPISPPRNILERAGDTYQGPKPSDRVAELLNCSELYLSAGVQKNAEGLSLALLEAMASGLPVVATAISGNTDVVREGHNGVLIEPASVESLADAVLGLFADTDRRRRMGRAAREVACQHSWLSVAHQYVEVYEAAIRAAPQAHFP